MSAISRVEAFAPGTSANLGVGFDILGMALRGVGDRVEAFRSDESGICIERITGDKRLIPRDASKNTAGIAVQALLSQLGVNQGVRLTIHKGLPLASGLGGSAASAVAAVVAVNALLGSPLEHEQLLAACIEGEAVVSGYHADNVAPCLLGGITLISGTRIEDIRPLPIPKNLHLALITPDVEVPTKDARSVLPQSISLAQVVSQTAAVARLVDALHCDDVRRMAEAVGSDGIVEPARSHLIPLFVDVCNAAKEYGAMSIVISGSGPTLCAFCESSEVAEQALIAMGQAYAQAGIHCSSQMVTQIDEKGAHTLSIE